MHWPIFVVHVAAHPDLVFDKSEDHFTIMGPVAIIVGGGYSSPAREDEPNGSWIFAEHALLVHWYTDTLSLGASVLNTENVNSTDVACPVSGIIHDCDSLFE
jgi:hypothetical protein